MDLQNPFLHEFLLCSGQVDGAFPEESLRRQRRLCFDYAWAVPTQEAIETLASYSPLLELGAGGGYWANLIAKAGGDIRAFDIFNGEWAPNRFWFAVENGGPEVVSQYPERTLFLCWPPYESSFAEDCLALYSGHFLLYAGEGRSGYCGGDGFFTRLNKEFELTKVVELPNRFAAHDNLSVYRRRS